MVVGTTLGELCVRPVFFLVLCFASAVLFRQLCIRYVSLALVCLIGSFFVDARILVCQRHVLQESVLLCLFVCWGWWRGGSVEMFLQNAHDVWPSFFKTRL